MTKVFGRWFTAVPQVYSHDPIYWNRDAGALRLAFRRFGIESKAVLLEGKDRSPDRPLELCSPQQIQSSAWWKQWSLEGVVLTSWGAPRYEPVARAIKESGAKLVIRLDSDGLKSPRQDFWRFLYFMYYFSRDSGRFLPLVQAALKTTLFRWVPAAFESRMFKHLEHADVLLIESPLAREALARFFSSVGKAHLVNRLHLISAPARGLLKYDGGTPKEKQIISVGRWLSCQKDGPMLVKVLSRVLLDQPEYKAIIIGSGKERLEQKIANTPEGVRTRLQVRGFMTYEDVQKEFLRSRVLFFSSRFEGFPFAVSEALLAGCSVVGPGTIPAFNYVCSQRCGTAAIGRSVEALWDALNAEIYMWDNQARDPEQISLHWQPLVSELGVVERILKAALR